MTEKTDGELIADRYWDLLLGSETYLDPWIAFCRAGIKWDHDSVYAFVHYVTADGLSKWMNAEVGTIQIEHDEYEDIDPKRLIELFKSGARDLKKFEVKARAKARAEAQAKVEDINLQRREKARAKAEAEAKKTEAKKKGTDSNEN